MKLTAGYIAKRVFGATDCRVETRRPRAFFVTEFDPPTRPSSVPPTYPRAIFAPSTPDAELGPFGESVISPRVRIAFAVNYSAKPHFRQNYAVWAIGERQADFANTGNPACLMAKLYFRSGKFMG
jgi:hypothetical protein